MSGPGLSVSCGVEFVEFPENIKEQVTRSGDEGYDLIVVPSWTSGQKIFQSEELLMESFYWRRYVVVRLGQSGHSKVDSKIESVRRTAEESLIKELSAVSHLDLQAVILSLKSEDNMNLARMLRSQMILGCLYSVWVEVKGDDWERWNRFRLTVDSSKVKVCLRLTEQLLSDLQLERWLGEPLAAVS